MEGCSLPELQRDSPGRLDIKRSSSELQFGRMSRFSSERPRAVSLQADTAVVSATHGIRTALKYHLRWLSLRLDFHA